MSNYSLLQTLGLLSVFASSFLVSLYLLPKLTDVATQIGLVDHPNGRKVHAMPRPLVGGIGMAIGFTVSALLFLPLSNLRGYYAGILLLVVIGFLDDFKEVNHRFKFVIQVVVALFLVYFSNTVLYTFGNLLGLGEMHLGWMAVPMTVFCTVGVINAINMIDGLDGLAGGVSLIALVSFTVLAAIDGQTQYMLLSIALTGAVLAFLSFNWQPARVFMGDAGSLLLGFSLAFLSIGVTQNSESSISPVVPLIILMIPIVDTVTIMVKRIMKGKNPFHADRYHLHHILLRLGIDKGNSVKVILAASAACSLVAIFGTIYGVRDSYLFLMFAMYALVYFTLSFHIRKMVKFKARLNLRRAKYEKRVFARSVECCEFEFYVPDPWPPYLEGKQPVNGKTTDISKGGVGMYTDYPFEAGQKIIVCRNGAKKTPYCMDVQWSKKVNGHYRVGLRHLQNGSAERLLKLLEQHSVEERRNG